MWTVWDLREKGKSVRARQPVQTSLALLTPAALVLALATGSASPTPSPASPGTAASVPVSCDTQALSSVVHLDHVTVDRAIAYTGGTFTTPDTGQQITGLPSFCAVDATQQDSAGNPMHITIWLPLEWNGRFQGIGGGGYSCGIRYTAAQPSLETALKTGYATAATDCGHTGGSQDGSFALNDDRTLDTALIDDFASTGIHGMTVVAKAITQAFYDRDVSYAYFNGCSTGGRQGLMEAQRFPGDYNGILSGAPAINWTKFIPSEMWPQLVMKESGDFLPACKANAFTAAVIKACDGLDGVTDGVIADVRGCRWNPKELVGVETACGTITETDATVIRKIWQGPTESPGGKSLWHGLEPGTDLSGLAATTTTDGSPFPIALSWLGTWLKQDPDWDWHTLTYDEFEKLFSQSVREFSDVIATDNPDLTSFQRNGGKLLLWHGLADQLIFPQGTVDYYQRVQHRMGGADTTASFARLFLAPGAAHCTSAAGPAPTDPLQSLVAWVEKRDAPASLHATLVDPATGNLTQSRLLCAYPLVARYNGTGNTADSAAYTCARSYRPQ